MRHFRRRKQTLAGTEPAKASRVEQPKPNVILYHESGTWTPLAGRETAFSNVFRWTVDSERGSIRLEHLRFGQGNPVYLFDLAPTADGVLESIEPHVCSQDLYVARMELDEVSILLSLGLAIGSRARQTPIRGGLMLEVSGQCVGGIGVSAGTEDEDTEVARAGVAAFVKG